MQPAAFIKGPVSADGAIDDRTVAPIQPAPAPAFSHGRRVVAAGCVPADDAVDDHRVTSGTFNPATVAGIYTGVGNRDIDFKSKAIAVRSENGPEHCIIDCQNQGRGFHFHTCVYAVSNDDHISICGCIYGCLDGRVF
ncbi:hypothetical protein ES703_113641 [subsurface metagenome]